MFTRFFLLVGALVTGACCATCQPRHSSPAALPAPDFQTETFRLSASPGCADGYPATIDEARFITSDGGSFPVPYGHYLEGDWGGSAIGWAVGDDQQPAPDSLEIRLVFLHGRQVLSGLLSLAPAAHSCPAQAGLLE